MYEYRVVVVEKLNGIEEILNEYGRAGWKLASMVKCLPRLYELAVLLVLERPKP